MENHSKNWYQILKEQFSGININLRQRTQTSDQYFAYLNGKNFQGVNRLFVLSFESNPVRTSHTEYFVLKIKIRYNNVMIDGRNFFDQSVKNDLRKYDNIQKIASFQGNDYKTGYLLSFFLFQKTL